MREARHALQQVPRCSPGYTTASGWRLGAAERRDLQELGARPLLEADTVSTEAAWLRGIGGDPRGESCVRNTLRNSLSGLWRGVSE